MEIENQISFAFSEMFFFFKGPGAVKIKAASDAYRSAMLILKTQVSAIISVAHLNVFFISVAHDSLLFTAVLSQRSNPSES